MHKIFAGLVLVLLAFAIPLAEADQKDPRLDKLFVQLKGATNPGESRPIEAKIWEIWMESGDQNVDALMAIGTAALNDQDYGQAYRAFGRVIQLAPKFAEGWNKRATALYLLGRFQDSSNAQLGNEKEALDAFEKALAINPNMPGIQQDADELKKSLAAKSI